MLPTVAARFVALACAGLLLSVGSAAYSATSPSATTAALQALARDSTFEWAKLHPLDATAEGLTSEDAELDTPSANARARDVALCKGWLARLDSIPLPHATLVERDDALLLRAGFVARLNGLSIDRFDEKDYSAPAQAIVNTLFTQFQYLPVARRNGAHASDVVRAWDAIISRMQKAPAYIVAGQRLVYQPGHLQGVVGSQALAGAPDFLSGALTAAAKAQVDRARFARFLAARDPLVKTIGHTKAYIDAHAARWPENYAMGARRYDAMLHDEQLLPFTAADVERMGREEIAHGWAQEAWLRSVAQARGTALGAPSGGGIAPSGNALIGYYRDRLTDLKRFMVDRHVVTVPEWLGDVQVVETPKFLQPVQPGAAMSEPRLFSPETTGYYFITPPKSLADAARRLDLYQDFDRDRILSTAAHEAMPGHFLQGSIARRHPDFVRRIQGSGVFAEGWAYYGEEMFVRLGLYGDDLDGPLDVAQWERIRGARAVLDAKLASGTWTYQQGVDFFAHETGATKDESAGAVASIALGPGYVISYTVGRFQLQHLLAEYLHRTGGRGSLHEFHDRLMCYGTTPFAAVEPELLADLHKPIARLRAEVRY